MSEVKKKSIHTEEEEFILARTKEIRLKVLNKLTENDRVPDKTSELRIMNEYMNSLDDMVDKAAAKRLKQDENENREAMAAAISEMLHKIDSKRTPVVGRDTSLPDIHVPIDIVPGETDINPERLKVSDFIDNLEDAK